MLILPRGQFAWQRDYCTPKGKPIVTDFERKYQRQGRPIYHIGFRKKEQPDRVLS